MLPSSRILERVRHHAQAVCGFRSGPTPVAAMMRSGCAIGAGFLLFLALGRADAGVVCAFFTNFLCLCDKADHVVTRVWVQVIGALVFTALGAVGVLLAGNTPLILVTVFAGALFAGFAHSTTPGAEAVPRYGLCCLVVAAFVPVDHADALAAVLLAAPIATAIVLLDDYLRHGQRGPHMKIVLAKHQLSGSALQPGVWMRCRCAAWRVGLIWSDVRPYWVTVTTLLVNAAGSAALTRCASHSASSAR